jgi:small subunit ribosomal protein S24e
MKIDIVDQRRNELLKRKELAFSMDHAGSGTPSRVEVRQKIADMVNADVERVYVGKIETKTGRRKAVGAANVYDSVEQATRVEPEYIRLRNAPEKEKKEKGSSKGKKKKRKGS